MRRFTLTILTLLLTFTANAEVTQPTPTPNTPSIDNTFIETCLADLETCLATQRHEIAKTGAVGITYQPYLDGGTVHGIEIVDVEPGKSAEVAGVRAGDRLIAWDGQAIDDHTIDAFAAAHRSLSVGQAVRYRIDRDGEFVEVALEAQPRTARSIDIRLGAWVYSTLGCEVYGTLWPEGTTP